MVYSGLAMGQVPMLLNLIQAMMGFLLPRNIGTLVHWRKDATFHCWSIFNINNTNAFLLDLINLSGLSVLLSVRFTHAVLFHFRRVVWCLISWGVLWQSFHGECLYLRGSSGITVCERHMECFEFYYHIIHIFSNFLKL